jgi:hypothetical protein
LHTKIQDTEAAAKYFEDELNFAIYPINLHRLILNKKQMFNIIDVRKATDYKAAFCMVLIGHYASPHKNVKQQESS